MKKIKLSIAGKIYELPSDTLCTGSKGKKYIYLNAKNTASLIKQYIKKLNQPISCWVTSSVYSGGCSVQVHLSMPDGSEVLESLYKQIEKFAYQFQAGNFDGMTDSYSYGENGETDNGTTLDYGTKYVFVENRPKFNTMENALKMIAEGNTPEDVMQYMGDVVKAKIREKFKTQ